MRCAALGLAASASFSKIEQNSSRVASAGTRAAIDFRKPATLVAPSPVVKQPSFSFRLGPSLLLGALAAFALAGCGSDDPRLVYGETQYLGGVYGNYPVASTAPVDNVSYWDGDGVPGKPSIKISLSEQRAYFYKGGQLVGISQLSTGREGLDTPTGDFRVREKDIDHASSRYGDYVDAN